MTVLPGSTWVLLNKIYKSFFFSSLNSVRACALTNAGHGPFSDPVSFRMDPALVKYPIVR